MASLGVTALTQSAADFRAVFSPELANSLDTLGTPVLAQALANTSPDARYEIANLLLDHGARADFAAGEDEEPPLRILLGAARHDIEQTTALVRRLIAAGANVNSRSRRGDGILDSLMLMGSDETELLPLYDLVFQQGLSGLETPNRAGLLPLQRAETRGRVELAGRIKAALEHEN
jgi:ankyrin repeat protein